MAGIICHICSHHSPAFGEFAMSRTHVQNQGRKDANDDDRPGRSSTLTTDENNSAEKIFPKIAML